VKFKATEDYLEELIEDAYEDMKSTQSEYVSAIESEVFDDTTWDNVFDEPVLQLRFVIGSSEYDDYDQWFLSDAGFSTEERSMPGFASRYYLTPRQELTLFTNYVEEFLASASKCSIDKFDDIPMNILEIMKSVEYFKQYNSEELMKIYEITNDEDLLPDSAKEMFLF
jgi:hypothetical protein